MGFLGFGGPSRKDAPPTDQDIQDAISFESPTGFVSEDLASIPTPMPTLTPTQMAWALAAGILLIKAAKK